MAHSTRHMRLEKATGDSSALTGTISSTGTAVTGSGTAFTTELIIGDFITCNGELRMVIAIESATALTLDEAPDVDFTADAFTNKTFTHIPAVQNASGPQNQSAQIPAETWDTEGFIEQVSGNTTPGTLSFTIALQPKVAGHRALWDDQAAGSILPWRKWLGDSVTIATNKPPHASNSRQCFYASVNGLSDDAPAGGLVTAAITLLVSGRARWLPGTDA